MIIAHSCRTAFALISITSAVCLGQSSGQTEPRFSLSLSGNCCNGTVYRYRLNQTGDSGMVTVRSTDRPISRVNFYHVRESIINCAMNLTEAAYGTPRDSADFSGDLSIAALDRTTIIRINTRVVIGTQSDCSMAVLLRLLMDQVDDTLRLPQVPFVKTRQGENMKKQEADPAERLLRATVAAAIAHLDDSLKRNLLPDKCAVIGSAGGNSILRLCYGDSRPMRRRWFSVSPAGDVLRELDFREAEMFGEVPWR